MLELVVITILVVSLVEMGAIVVYKIPVLRSLPVLEKKLSKRKKISWSSIFRKKIKNFWFSLNKKISLNLKDFKKYSKEKETKFSDDYWDKIRKE